MTAVIEDPPRVNPGRREMLFGIAYRIRVTDDPDERRRYRADVEEISAPLPDLVVGQVIGWGRSPGRARRRAVEKIANRRRGPARSRYEFAGVTFAVGPNPDATQPGHMSIATVLAVAATSPLRTLIRPGQILTTLRSAPNVADRAFCLLGSMVERTRVEAIRRRLLDEIEADVVAAAPADERSWRDAAACRRLDPETWFPDAGSAASQAVAVRVCTACPVRTECLAHAIEQREACGVWGGVTEAGRRKMLRRGLTAEEVVFRGADAFIERHPAKPPKNR